MKKEIDVGQIMDVTLRDGSYAINFQFSDYDTREISVELEKCNIPYIEIGHGLGIGASSSKYGYALSTDEEYLLIVQKSLKKSKFGMFCIPGIAEIKDLDLIKKYGASFVRIGTNIDKVKESEPFIKHAKDLGLEVMSNYMKSYAANEREFAKCVKMSEDFGSDVIYVVDSAGCMLPETIKMYYDVIKNNSKLKTGFHGHNNLGLAVSNSIYALELGFDIVDSSLQGLGRSAGNAATELLASIIKIKYNLDTYDSFNLIKIAEKYIRPLIRDVGNYGLDIVSGMAGFHSSYMKYIHKYAVKYGINPYDLIIVYSKYDQVNLDESELEIIARKLPKEDVPFSEYGFHRYIGDEQNIK
jgi:4-hydroxy 2-oxovalerate aldolase